VDEGQIRLRQIDRERSLQSLMVTNLLKRLESSVYAFRLTLRTLKKKMTATLDDIENFHKNGKMVRVETCNSDFSDLETEDEDLPSAEDFKTGGKVQISLSDMDTETWRKDLRADLLVLNEILASMDCIRPEDDNKLEHLKNLIERKISAPLNPGNRKVLIFTAFADTADYLYQNIADFFRQKSGLHTARVTGRSSPETTLKKNYDFLSVLTLFSPFAKEKNIVMPEEPGVIDILIGTDCISEGQNLQDCDYLINYDIHWNPVRIIQRFGRIDRIGSKNNIIQLVNYWPDISLDEYINLKERVEKRMVIADVTATGDDNVLSPKSSEASYREEQLRRLQEEVIELEDLKTGVSITNLGLNDFRMDLLNHIKNQGDIEKAPKGMHAVIPVKNELGMKPGIIFALRNVNESVNINQQNRLHPYYLIYIAEDGEIIIDHTEVKKLLDLVRSCCKGLSEPVHKLCSIFNARTDDGRNMKACSELLNAAIGSMIEIKTQKDIDSLFSGGKTTALTDTIKGLDDFELIAFLMVQGEE
jgi:SNF2 family DNA or RNA helicase